MKLIFGYQSSTIYVLKWIVAVSNTVVFRSRALSFKVRLELERRVNKIEKYIQETRKALEAQFNVTLNFYNEHKAIVTYSLTVAYAFSLSLCES